MLIHVERRLVELYMSIKFERVGKKIKYIDKYYLGET